jgi:cell division septum initiation protein DivIVA
MSSPQHPFGDPYPQTGGEPGDISDTSDIALRSATSPSGTDGGSDASSAAARLLEKTARETDQWREDARAEAAATLSAARDEAAQVVRAAREEAERLVAAAREEADRAVNDARVEAYRVREQTNAARQGHEEDIARLQQVATQHRERLRQHLTEMLGQVDSAPGGEGQ